MTEKTVSLELMPSTVDAEILRLSGLLESVTEKLAASILEDAESEAHWKRMEASSLLRSEKRSEDLRKAEAVDRYGDQYARSVVDSAKRDAYTEKARSIRMRIEALRTLSANLRGMT